MNRSSGFDIVVSASPVVNTQSSFLAQALSTTGSVQSSNIPPSPIFKRRRIDETLAKNIIIKDTSDRNAYNICRSLRELNKLKKFRICKIVIN